MVRTSAIKHRGPAQNRVLDNDIVLLRKVDFKRLGRNTVETLRETPLRAGEPEGDQPWFLDGYVAAEQPRDMQISEALLDATQGFALARTDTGEIVASFKKDEYIKASDVAQRATLDVAVSVLTAEDDEVEDED